jgi:hypothetical protein
LIGENAPEWGLSYFGILHAGATCIPMDKDLSTDEIVNLLRSGKAKGMILTEKLLKKSSLEQMWTPVKLNDGKTYSYGFGWFRGEVRGHPIIEHSGLGSKDSMLNQHRLGVGDVSADNSRRPE